jgi:small-conductance mechanosensitive channel
MSAAMATVANMLMRALQLLAPALLVFLLGVSALHAAPAAEALDPAIRDGITVMHAGEELFRVRRPIGGLDVKQRATAIGSRLDLALRELDPSTARLAIVGGAETHDVYLGPRLIVSVTDADAAAENTSREARAAQLQQRLELVLKQANEAASAAGRARLIVTVLVAVLLLALLWSILGRGARALLNRLNAGASARRGLRLGRAEILSGSQVAETLSTMVGVARALLLLLASVATAVFVLSLHPRTRPAAMQLEEGSLDALSSIGRAIAGYLPNLVYIALIIVIARVLIGITRGLFEQIGRGEIYFRGFYREWAQPTYSITRFILVVFTIILLYPYLPASNSVAFQGVSVLVGLIVSIGSASAIANVIGGLVITYMRAFKVGDRVRIGDTEGDVVSRDAFVVQLRTIKNVEVTIPNSLVLNSHVINQSAAARAAGLILHTSVTIGYDAPWRRVHELLRAAAAATPGVESDPAPFVLQTALNDFHVSYEINAHTRDAARSAQLLSDLRARIQDQFNAAGIEILSPAYEARRDGSASTSVPPDGSLAPNEGGR